MTVDVAQLVDDMMVAASGVLERDITTLRGFSARQLKAIAQQTQLVTDGINNGQITEETQDFFLDGIEDMTLSFVKTLRGLLMVTIEKVWNEMVRVIWGVIESVSGIPLPSLEQN